MGVPIVREGSYCICGERVDSWGLHCLNCKNRYISNKLRNPAHAKLSRVFRYLLKRTNHYKQFQSLQDLISEPKLSEHFNVKSKYNVTDDDVFAGDPIDDKEFRADVVLYTPKETYLCDATIILPFAQYVVKSYKEAGDAAEFAEVRKLKEYRRKFQIDDKDNMNKLVIIAAEHWGCLSKNTKLFCRKLSNMLDSDSNLNLLFIYQQISVCLQNIRASQFSYCNTVFISPSKPSASFLNGNIVVS
jgi:hypothetical protein